MLSRVSQGLAVKMASREWGESRETSRSTCHALFLFVPRRRSIDSSYLGFVESSAADSEANEGGSTYLPAHALIKGGVFAEDRGKLTDTSGMVRALKEGWQISCNALLLLLSQNPPYVRLKEWKDSCWLYWCRANKA